MTQIEVKDSTWYREAYGMNKIRVFVNETKAEHDAKRKHEYDLYIYNRDMGYAGFDEHPDSEPEKEWDHE